MLYYSRLWKNLQIIALNWWNNSCLNLFWCTPKYQRSVSTINGKHWLQFMALFFAMIQLPKAFIKLWLFPMMGPNFQTAAPLSLLCCALLEAVRGWRWGWGGGLWLCPAWTGRRARLPSFPSLKLLRDIVCCSVAWEACRKRSGN